ncbi:phenylacetate--CoA ligase family protein [Winogradskyella sp. KYW1333]|uniref:phenylacetate--CoA ligase family protein n=1 Tax=Winogradskyella sp. KYW1333 TaxID=2282123 RepID=UPI000DF2379C|nr:phenylacetate--CoA ligase family protein [Winogradskyella sp. KYW1333]RCT54360.1 phenylacetate--CoA ligase family protein [Winogradskyella sp. KYW1333]
MLFNYLRNILFWFLDSIKGGYIRKQIKEIKYSVIHPESSNSENLKKKYIDKLLIHATNSTPYYSSYKNFNSIQDFPVIKKVIIQQNFDKFQSTEYKDKDNFKVSTSGSTGVPFFLYQDKNKRRRNHSDVIYFLKESGFKIGNRLYELEVWRGHNEKNRLKAWLQNTIQFDISKLTDKRIESFIELLKNDKQSKKTMLGFASSYEMIAQYMERNNIFLDNLGLTSAVANSEYLNPYTKTTLGKHLNTQILSRYSSEEIGIIAQQTLNSPNSFVINHASYVVEVLQFDNNESVKPGEFGRIVVTDLFNFAMPIIRYDTGDIAKLGINDDGVIQLDEIEGRKMDVIYDSDGNLISSFVVYTKFYKYYHLLKQYQFIQQSEKDYEVKLNLQGNTFAFEDDLIAIIKSDFGEDSNVTITYVDEIPPLSSGKRRKVVNNYKKS